MIAAILYVTIFFGMAIGLIIIVHRTVTAEEARVARRYNPSTLRQYEPAVEPEHRRAA